MKYPALLPADQVIAELDMFDSIIDVRSPAEFALDHIPGAINCPVLNAPSTNNKVRSKLASSARRS
jgi:tRNA 2-selenouridine synthase